MTRDVVLMIFEAMLVASAVVIGVGAYSIWVLLVAGHL